MYKYDIRRATVKLVYESGGQQQFSGPDNITMSPRGSLLICEDRVGMNKSAQSLAGLTADGRLFRFCQVNPRVSGRHKGFDLTRTLLKSEWAGVSFSLDGNWLFCNLYDPGLTLAITGPWQEDLI